MTFVLDDGYEDQKKFLDEDQKKFLAEVAEVRETLKKLASERPKKFWQRDREAPDYREPSSQ